MCGAATTLCAKYNDLESVRAVFKENKDEIAGIILEPVVGNSGFIAPTQEFLEVLDPGHCMGICTGCVLLTSCQVSIQVFEAPRSVVVLCLLRCRTLAG